MSIALMIGGGIVAYLLGSIPTAVWLGRAKYGIDIREHGSGNAGATNTFRVLGKKAGSVVMAIDVLKGFLATFLPILFTHLQWENLQGEELALYQIAFGIIAVTGHILPIFAGFKGGKGVATLLGMVLAIHSLAALTCVAVFLAIFLTSGYVSLGSMLAGVTFPILMNFSFYQTDEKFNKVLFVFGVIVASLLIFTHRKNIKRLIKGEENSFKKKKKAENE